MPLDTQFKKGVLEICILAVIARKPCYGYDLLQQLIPLGITITEGTLYPLLSRLRQDGLVESSLQESAVGQARRYYSLSAKGVNALKEGALEYKKFAQSVDNLLSSYYE